MKRHYTGKARVAQTRFLSLRLFICTGSLPFRPRQLGDGAVLLQHAQGLPLNPAFRSLALQPCGCALIPVTVICFPVGAMPIGSPLYVP